MIFDGGKDEIIDDEDAEFYKHLVDITYAKGTFSNYKGYKTIHVIITRIDIFERRINEKYKNLSECERSNILNTSKDLKIEHIIEAIGILRSNIYFIENYHSGLDHNTIDVDHQALKILTDILNASEQYMFLYLNNNASCFC